MSLVSSQFYRTGLKWCHGRLTRTVAFRGRSQKICEAVSTDWWEGAVAALVRWPFGMPTGRAWDKRER